MSQPGCMDVVGDCAENLTVEINNFCWSFIQDLKRGHIFRSSVCLIGEWLSIQLITLFIWIACFPPTYGISYIVRWKTESVSLQTLWLYQQSYVLCCSAWINFTTCCCFSELTVLNTCSSCVIGTEWYSVAVKGSAGYMRIRWKSAELSVSFKSH